MSHSEEINVNDLQKLPSFEEFIWMPESELDNLSSFGNQPTSMPPIAETPTFGSGQEEMEVEGAVGRLGDMPPPVFSGEDVAPVFAVEPVSQDKAEDTLKVAKGFKAFLLERSLKRSKEPSEEPKNLTNLGISEDDPYARLLRPLTNSEIGYLKEQVSHEEVIYDRWTAHQRRVGFRSQAGGVLGLAVFCLLIWQTGKSYLNDLGEGLPQPAWFDQLPNYQEEALLVGAVIAPILLLILLMNAGSNLLRSTAPLGRMQFIVRGSVFLLGAIVMLFALSERLILTALIVGVFFYLLSKFSGLITKLIGGRQDG